MDDKKVTELIQAWIKLTSIIKNNRIFTNITYNEAIILNLVYSAYLENRPIYTKEIISTTKMLKSLVNRTINYLIAKNFIYTSLDKNQLLLHFNPQMESNYQEIHNHTLNYLKPILAKLNSDEIADFIKIVNKISEEL